jgi:hypothetical protein
VRIRLAEETYDTRLYSGSDHSAETHFETPKLVEHYPHTQRYLDSTLERGGDIVMCVPYPIRPHCGLVHGNLSAVHGYLYFTFHLYYTWCKVLERMQGFTVMCDIFIEASSLCSKT